MGRDLTVTRTKRLQKQVMQMQRGKQFHARSSRQAVDHHRNSLPWRSRNLGLIIVGGLFGTLLLIVVMVGFVTKASYESAQNNQMVNELVTSVKDLIERERGQKERERAERAKLSEEQRATRDKGALIFWIAASAALMMFSFQFAGLWGVGIALLSIVSIVGVVMGYIAL